MFINQAQQATIYTPMFINTELINGEYQQNGNTTPLLQWQSPRNEKGSVAASCACTSTRTDRSSNGAFFSSWNGQTNLNLIGIPQGNEPLSKIDNSHLLCYLKYRKSTHSKADAPNGVKLAYLVDQTR